MKNLSEIEIRPLTSSEILQISGGNGERDEGMGSLPPIEVRSEADYFLPVAGGWIAPLIGGFGAGWEVAKEMQAAKDAHEAKVGEMVSPSTVAGAPGPVLINSSGGMATGVMLNNGFYAADRDGNGKMDLIVSPPWTNPSGRVMTFSNGGVWGFDF